MKSVQLHLKNDATYVNTASAKVADHLWQQIRSEVYHNLRYPLWLALVPEIRDVITVQLRGWDE